MAFPFMAAAAGLGAGLDFMGQSSAASAQKKALHKALKILRGNLAEQRVAGGLALQEQRRGLADIQGGFQSGLNALSTAGRAASIDARDNAAKAFGGAEQDLISMGMLNPEHLAFARSGVSSGLSRVLAGIQNDVASRRASLLTQGGMASAGQRGNIAAQIGQNFQGRSDITSNMAQLGIDSAPQAPPSYGADLGWLFQALKAGN